jgi:inhibitor of cysteine peptidase
MLRRVHFFFPLFIAVIVIISCSTTHAPSVRLTQADNGSHITLHPGDTLEIALAGNPTTGYTWEVQPGAEAVVRQQGAPEFKAESARIGAGGTMTFRFAYVAAGAVIVSLIYHRGFEPGVAPLQTFAVTVKCVKK